MKKVSFVTDASHQSNKIFHADRSELKIGNHDKYYELHRAFLARKYHIATDDLHEPLVSDIVIYFDLPRKLPIITPYQKSYLLAIESSIIRPENFNIDYHHFFNKIFTWNDSLVDNEKYIKINYAFRLPNTIDKDIQGRKLCCLIASNKKSSFKNELYSERKKIIRWFEKNFPQDFDLYGYGWDSYRFDEIKPWRRLNKVPIFPKLIYKIPGIRHPSYRGSICSKSEVLRKYKFSIAFENVKGELGYITEKIFDVFIAGCVPIYWGAANISDHIPSDCFIDRRDFENNETLYNYLRTMNNGHYRSYLDNIEKFLQSEKAKKFSTKYFADTIVTHTLAAME